MCSDLFSWTLAVIYVSNFLKLLFTALQVERDHSTVPGTAEARRWTERQWGEHGCPTVAEPEPPAPSSSLGRWHRRSAGCGLHYAGGLPAINISHFLSSPELCYMYGYTVFLNTVVAAYPISNEYGGVRHVKVWPGWTQQLVWTGVLEGMNSAISVTWCSRRHELSNKVR